MATSDIKSEAKTPTSEKVRLLLGVDLHSWEQVMLYSLAVAGVAALAVFIATAAVVISQRRENTETKAEFERYKVSVGATIAEANERTINAELALEKERVARLKLEAKVAPRSIPQAEQNKLTAALKGFDKQTGTIKASPSLPEREMFARILAAPLREAGWDIVPVQGDNFTTFLIPGVIIRYSSEYSDRKNWILTKSPAADRLAELLRDMGITL